MTIQERWNETFQMWIGLAPRNAPTKAQTIIFDDEPHRRRKRTFPRTRSPPAVEFDDILPDELVQVHGS